MEIETGKLKSEEISDNERYFLEGSHSRTAELFFVFRVMMEFVNGFRKLAFVGPCVTVFGSARFNEGNIYYEMARKAGSEISKMGFTIMTGGGPGIMEAANRGASESGGRSVGCNIKLGMEQTPNPYLDKWITLDHFFVRKVLLLKYSYAFVVMPGGFGTMDELFETLTLIQTKKVKNFPVILMGKDYWTGLIAFMNELDDRGTINAEDLQLLLITDDIEEAKQHIQKFAIDTFELKRRRELKPVTILGE